MRSGTTVLHRALCQARNSNPYISESWFLHDLFMTYDRCMSRYDVRMADQFGDVSKFEDLIRYDIEFYLDTVSEKYGKPEMLILKHPELTRHFLTIRRLVPGFKFLVIVRDPRDVIGSIKTVNERHRATNTWSPTVKFQTMEEYCRFYLHYYWNLFTQQQEFGGDLMIIRYEDAVTNPQETFAKVGAFSGAVYAGEEMKSFDPDQTESQNLRPEVRLQDPFSGAFWSDLYTKELSPETIGRYKERLTPAEVSQIEVMLDNVGKPFGYW